MFHKPRLLIECTMLVKTETILDELKKTDGCQVYALRDDEESYRLTDQTTRIYTEIVVRKEWLNVVVNNEHIIAVIGESDSSYCLSRWSR